MYDGFQRKSRNSIQVAQKTSFSQEETTDGIACTSDLTLSSLPIAEKILKFNVNMGRI